MKFLPEMRSGFDKSLLRFTRHRKAAQFVLLFCNTVLLQWDVRRQFLEIRSLCLALFSGNPDTVLRVSEYAGRNVPKVLQPLPAPCQGNPAAVLFLSVSDVCTGFLTDAVFQNLSFDALQEAWERASVW